MPEDKRADPSQILHAKARGEGQEDRPAKGNRRENISVGAGPPPPGHEKHPGDDQQLHHVHDRTLRGIIGKSRNHEVKLRNSAEVQKIGDSPQAPSAVVGEDVAEKLLRRGDQRCAPAGQHGDRRGEEKGPRAATVPPVEEKRRGEQNGDDFHLATQPEKEAAEHWMPVETGGSGQGHPQRQEWIVIAVVARNHEGHRARCQQRDRPPGRRLPEFPAEMQEDEHHRQIGQNRREAMIEGESQPLSAGPLIGQVAGRRRAKAGG